MLRVKKVERTDELTDDHGEAIFDDDGEELIIDEED